MTTSQPFLRASFILLTGVIMGIMDYFRKTQKDVMCPECEKHKRHVKLVESEGKTLECPECHYAHLARR